MTYVMSDLHGMYQKFLAMLRLIRFGAQDELYLLGDIVDRGEEPVRLLEAICERSNIIPLLGNHEVMAICLLRRLQTEISEESISTVLTKNTLYALSIYLENGGGTTLREFSKLPLQKRELLLEYLESFLPYEAIDVGENSFVLVHAGLGNFKIQKKFSEYTLPELLEMRPDYTKQYFPQDNIYIVSGHTPTPFLHGKPEIYRSDHNIVIDCGAAIGGRLACLRLEDMQEFYL